MHAIPLDTNPHRLLELVPQDVLARAFKVSGLPRTEEWRLFAESDLKRLAEAAQQFLVMGPSWNRPDPL